MVIDVRDLYDKLDEYMGKNVTLQGWIRNHRKQKEFGFIDFNDGTYFKSVQVVYDDKLSQFDEIQKLRIGSAIEVIGNVISSPAKGQDFEIQVEEINLLNDLGIDVIVTDHHLPGDNLPKAIAIIDPKLDNLEEVYRQLKIQLQRNENELMFVSQIPIMDKARLMSLLKHCCGMVMSELKVNKKMYINIEEDVVSICW